jgi:hypothetical protein
MLKTGSDGDFKTIARHLIAREKAARNPIREIPHVPAANRTLR